MAKLPAFQFYPADWLKDANLRRCSPNARAFWIDLLCIMFECENRGVLATNGEAWTEEEIARAVPGDTYQNILALQELLRNQVARKNRAGFVYSKRMVEDDEERLRWRKSKQNHKDKTDLIPAIFRPNSRLSSSSSSSSSSVLSPLPPADAGGLESVFTWCRQTIAVQMGRHKRLPLKEAHQGSRAEEIVEFLNQRGFPARIVRTQ